MTQLLDVRVPDIGDFKDVPVIEVLVKPGDAVKANDSLITLESEKAAMEVPSPGEGIVEHVSVNVGDKVSEGTVIVQLSTQETAQPQKDSLVDLRVPDIGDFKDIPVIDVLVRPGDEIAKDAALIVLESEKATMEVPAQAAGTLAEIKVKPGDKVSQGSLIATLHARANAPRSETVVSATPAATPAAPPHAPPSATVSTAPPAASASGNGTVHASPSIRRFARELGVELHRVPASGPNGRITRDNVENFVKRALQNGGTGVAANAGIATAPWPSVDFAQYGEIERVQLSRIKKISGPNLHRNWVMIPHVTQNDDADVTDLEALRKQVNAEAGPNGAKLTMLTFLIAGCLAALKKFPDFNRLARRRRTGAQKVLPYRICGRHAGRTARSGGARRG